MSPGPGPHLVLPGPSCRSGLCFAPVHCSLVVSGCAVQGQGRQSWLSRTAEPPQGLPTDVCTELGDVGVAGLHVWLPKNTAIHPGGFRPATLEPALACREGRGQRLGQEGLGLSEGCLPATPFPATLRCGQSPSVRDTRQERLLPSAPSLSVCFGTLGLEHVEGHLGIPVGVAVSCPAVPAPHGPAAAGRAGSGLRPLGCGSLRRKGQHVRSCFSKGIPKQPTQRRHGP